MSGIDLHMDSLQQAETQPRQNKIHCIPRSKATSPLANLILHIGQAYIHPSQSVRNLGAIFDTHLTMIPQVEEMWTSAMTYVRHLGKIARSSQGVQRR